MRSKRKLLLTAAFTALLGVGAFAGVSSVKKSFNAEAVSAGETVYLLPNSNWASDNARFAMYYFGNGDGWTDMSAVSGTGFYQATIPSGYTTIILCRMDPATTENNWDNKWNQTDNLDLDQSTGNTYKITGWDNSGNWFGTYNEDFAGSDGIYLCGSELSWNFDGAIKMDASSGEYAAQVINYHATSGEKIKLRASYLNDNPQAKWGYYTAGNKTFGGGDGESNFVFSYDIDVDIYAKWENSQLNLYLFEHVSVSDGYYMLGDANFVSDISKTGAPWTFSSAAHMTSLSGEGNKASFVITTSALVEFRVKSLFSGTETWLSFGENYDGANGITKVGDNVTLASGSSYAIYVNHESLVYVARGIPLDAFCSDFLTEIVSVCSSTGNTNLTSLRNKWSSLSTLYSDVFAADKAIIVAIGFNGGSDVDDAHIVVKAYHYIVTKYGTSNCADFIWGQTIAGTYSAVRIISEKISTSAGSTIVIIAISSVSLAAIGGYFLFRKKKEN